MAGDLKLKYGTANQTITITLASLDGTASATSNEIDNATNLFMDVLVQVKIKTAGTVLATGAVNVYALASVNTGTSYPDATNIKTALLGSFNAATTATTYISNPMSIARAFGCMPEKWKIVVENQTQVTGQTFSATAGDHAAIYQGVYSQYT
jgi:hypothetical protein